MINPGLIDSTLSGVATALDISDEIREEADAKYQDIVSHLADGLSPLLKFGPKIYTQGSFRLGTIIRPLKKSHQYDIDIVCRVEIKKTDTTQKELKKLIGDRLKDHLEFGSLVKEKRRCWRIEFSKQFHVDVLPSIANEETPPNGILITDKELLRWQKSNPIAYSNWFKNRMTYAIKVATESLQKSLGAEVEEIPEWKIKTSLQKSIQIIKRHRDYYFRQDPTYAPKSIIISTLAAHAYEGDIDLQSCLDGVLGRMDMFLTKDDGKWYVKNPTDEDENFAEVWNTDTTYEETFGKWLSAARVDLRFDELEDEAALNSKINRVLGVNPATSQFEVWTPDSPAPLLIDLWSDQVEGLAESNHARSPKWLTSIQFKVQVKSEFYQRKVGIAIGKLTLLPISKSRFIKFEALTNTPYPFEVFWQVVNTGREATSARGLRGDFYPSDAGLAGRWEPTQYRGTHWVEAFVIKDGICVARSGRVLVLIR